MATDRLEVIIAGRDQFSATANRVTGSLNNLSRSAGKVGKGVGQVGAGLGRVAVIAGTAAVGGIAAVAKTAIDFEDAFAGVRKTLDATPAQLDRISREFRDLATEIPISATELSRIGEIAGQLGIKADDITEFTKTVALLGVAAPQLSTEEAAFGLSRILTLTGQTTDKADELASVIVDLGNRFATTEPAIVETAQRFASVANAAGISTQGVLGLAAAVTALGGEPQEAGTSLQRSIQRITLAVADGGKELDLFAAVAGVSTRKFRRAWEEDALGTFQRFLKGLGEVESNVERTKILDELGLSDARLGKTILNLATALDTTNGAIDTSNKAWKENSALSEEAEKRFATLKSQLTLLKNNLIEGALVMAEGFTPAIGRAAEKLRKFLQLPGTKADLRRLGEQIGEFIDGIDWGRVIDGAKTLFGVFKEIVGLVAKIPAEVTATVAAFAGINKLSGGLIGRGIGNIVGGLAGAATRGIASRLPGVGAVFAQPVFVTNWPIGLGAGGALGGAGRVGGIGVGTLLGGAALTAGAAAAVYAVQQEISRSTAETAGQLTSQVQRYINENDLSQDEILSSLGAVNQGIADIRSNPLSFLVGGDDALAELEEQKRLLERQLSLTSESNTDRYQGEKSMRDVFERNISGLRTSIDNQPPPSVSVTVNVTGREVTKSVNTSTSYGATTSSYYGGTILRTGTGGSAIY